MMRKSVKFLFFWFLFLPTALCLARAVPEYHAKAAFIYNFCKFIQWPDNAFTENDAPIVLGVYDAAPFGAALNALEGRMIGRRRLKVQEFHEPYQLKKCHVAYLNVSDAATARRLLHAADDLPIVTVGEEFSFLADGGMIRFFRDGQKIRFSIKYEAVKKAGLRISSHLLKLSTQSDAEEGAVQ